MFPNASSKEVLQPVDKEENKILVMTFHLAPENWSNALKLFSEYTSPQTTEHTEHGHGARGQQQPEAGSQSAISRGSLSSLQSRLGPAPSSLALDCHDCHRLSRSGSEHYTVTSSSQQLKLIWRKYCAF